MNDWLSERVSEDFQEEEDFQHLSVNIVRMSIENDGFEFIFVLLTSGLWSLSTFLYALRL